ncbi:MAG TPA: 16S rRNA (adenine(1518)-N(6)/adenine(1519)-N(6))-dimethyltransferase RsmA [Actinomycetota bacterium]|nr:16S rRNA (adenine(1518)-N(6)/adenine(1519)-N(6))-dimethyltransferase RsmA [Actinomycetota bacterium]
MRALLAAHGLRPTRALGQNYLVDPNTARKIVRLAEVEPGETVLEIGPGLGSLTLALRRAGARVVAVEADERLLPALAEAIGDDPGVRVVAGDALRLDLAGLAPDARKLVANLPYNLAATLVLEVLTSYPSYQRLTVMVQREVGERLAASPGSGAYGATSVKVAALAEARLLARIGRKVFLPEPHVDSVLVGLRRRPHPAIQGLPWPVLDRTIEAAFSQRRKTLRNSLRTLGLDQHEVEALGHAARVDLGLRAERLDVAAFAALAAALRRMPAFLDRHG